MSDGRSVGVVLIGLIVLVLAVFVLLSIATMIVVGTVTFLAGVVRFMMPRRRRHH